MRSPSTSMTLGNCRVLMLKKMHPPLRGEKRFILMKMGYVNTSLFFAVLLHFIKKDSDLLLRIKVGAVKV